MTEHFDLFVIGAGSGGVRAARMAAQYGAKVAIAEERYLGGTCVNVGCVPKKLFVYAAEFSQAFRDAASFGWQVPPVQFDWRTLRDNKNREILRLNNVYGQLLDNRGVELMEGRAVITSPHSVAVNGKLYRCKNILIATGSWPYVPDTPGREHVITSNEIFHLENFPQKAVIVGGGYIAVEFAGILQGLGVATHLVYRGPLFLKGFDRDVREQLAVQMQQQGIGLHFSQDVTAIEKNTDGSLSVKLAGGHSITTDLAMYATGRQPNTQGLGLENTRIVTDENGAIPVDAQLQTAEPGIYALGDVISRVRLTPVAIAEGAMLANNLFNGGNAIMDYTFIPTAVFSQPAIGTVGFTEAQAREKYSDIRVYKTGFRPMKKTLSGGGEKMLIKLIVDNKTDRVIGCQMLGENAAEIIQGMAIAIKAGATKADFDHTIGIHPTAAEEFVTLKEVFSD